MTFWKDITSKVGGALFENDSTDKPNPPSGSIPTPLPIPITTPIPYTNGGVPYSANPGTSTAALPANADLYNMLLTKTDFNNSSIGHLLNKYNDPLKDLPIDDRTRLQKVLQLGNAEGLTPDKILSTVSIQLTTLDDEAQKFTASLQAATQTEVTARQQKMEQMTKAIADLQKQISDTQQQQMELSTVLVQAQAKIQMTQNQFDMALEQRKTELNQLLAKFKSLLGVA